MKPELGYLCFTNFDGETITLPKAETAKSQGLSKEVALKNLEEYGRQLKESHPSKNKLKKFKVEKAKYNDVYKASEAKAAESAEEKVPEAAGWFSWLPSWS